MTYKLAASAFLVLLSVFMLASTPSVYAILTDLHLSLVWLGGEKSTDYATIPMEDETFFVHAYVMSKGVLGSAVNASVTMNLDNYTRQEELLSLNPNDDGGVASFGPFKANRGTHIVRIEVNPDRRIIENNYVDNVKVLSFSVLAEVKDHAIESAVGAPIWNYSRTAEISVKIGVGNYKKPNSFLIAASSDGHVIAVGSNEGTLVLFDEAGVIKWTHDFGAGYGAVYALSVSDNGEFVAVGSESDVGNVYLFASNGALLFKKSIKGLFCPDVSVTDSGDVLSSGGTVTLYDKLGNTKWASRPFPEEIDRYWYNAWFQQLKPASFTRPVSTTQAQSAAISADGSLVVIGTGKAGFLYTLGHYGVYFLDGRTGRTLWNYTESDSGHYYFSKVFVSPDGSEVVASNEGGNTYVFQSAGSRCIALLDADAQ